jgi:hypothetical protein
MQQNHEPLCDLWRIPLAMQLPMCNVNKLYSVDIDRYGELREWADYLSVWVFGRS